MQKWIKLLRLWQNAVEDKDRVPTLLVVGLGNPGKEYQDTRHNLGFKVVQEIAKREKISWKKEKLLEAEVAFLVKEGKEVALLMPQTYMNVSGRAVNAFLHRYKSCESFIVVVDDVTLDLGKVDISRVNPKRHNGLISIGECVKAREYPRLRLGIGPCPQGEVLAEDRKSVV